MGCSPALCPRIGSGLPMTLCRMSGTESRPLTSYLLMVNIQNALERQLLEIEAVALVEVGADCLGVVVHHHCALAHLSEGTDTGNGTPVELHAAAWNTSECQTEPTFTHKLLNPCSDFSYRDYGRETDSDGTRV